MIRDAKPEDADAIARIYNHYIEHTTITFEETLLTGEQMADRVTAVQDRFPWIVVEVEGGVSGYAYARRWQERAAYRHSVELSVFLDPQQQGKGLGSRLYRELFSQLQRLDVHVMIGGVALPNAPSVALHESFGFEKVAHFREVGYKLGRWIDVGYWQRQLETTQENA